MFGKEKVEIDTQKLYYGFPIIFLGYKDDKFKYNVTTTSSSYTLGNTITIGVGKVNKAAAQILKYKEFTVNIPCENLMAEIEICGFFSGNNKLQQADLPYTVGKYVDAPLVDECFLAMECVVKDVIEDGEYLHIVGDIKRRVADKDLVKDENLFASELIKTVHYAGCSTKRVYRYLKEDVATLGDFVEDGTSNCG